MIKKHKADNNLGEPLEGYRKVCPVCGSDFWARYDWVYKKFYGKKQTYYCSWKCLRKVERENMTIGMKITMMIKAGKTDKEIKQELGVTQYQIDYRKEREV